MTDCTVGFMSVSNSEYYVPDTSIQASSADPMGGYEAYNARLHGNGNWYPDTGDTQPWIQADLGREVEVYGIQIQGDGGYYWVTTLKVSTFQNVPETGEVGDFIQDGNDVKVCIKQKQ